MGLKKNEQGGKGNKYIIIVLRGTYLLLGVLDAVTAVADVAADIEGIVATDGAGGAVRGLFLKERKVVNTVRV